MKSFIVVGGSKVVYQSGVGDDMVMLMAVEVG